MEIENLLKLFLHRLECNKGRKNGTSHLLGSSVHGHNIEHGGKDSNLLPFPKETKASFRQKEACFFSRWRLVVHLLHRHFWENWTRGGLENRAPFWEKEGPLGF
ncbi:hypothetical protein TNIN_390551 [Trichonephila inaurata madagascariensis]|uniref:Uncharacterized protein n=1 Tax=Trichonephila inaurata madagascariensis TaxID=2747483 RepID=A0A8X6YM28_9ARAC|nr:hypothetical protein TNIN_390551 [Trichonephila inaurata madagascariensis]